MIRLRFRDGCTGDDEEHMTFTAPRSFFWEFARWCEEGRSRTERMLEDGTQRKEYSTPEGKQTAERLVREQAGKPEPELDTERYRAAGEAGKHWSIEGPRYVIDWFSVFYEHNRGGVSYRDPENHEEPVYEIIMGSLRTGPTRIHKKAVEV